MGDTEEDKKALIAMLGKLYITANSRTEKLQSAIELVVEAIEGKVAQDAPSRNSLNKLHSALTKALGEAGKFNHISEDTPAPASLHLCPGRGKGWRGFDGLATVDEQRVEEYSMAHDEDVRMQDAEDGGVTGVQDSLLEELLDDEEDDL